VPIAVKICSQARGATKSAISMGGPAKLEGTEKPRKSGKKAKISGEKVEKTAACTRTSDATNGEAVMEVD
jgi:hypothetical protein